MKPRTGLQKDSFRVVDLFWCLGLTLTGWHILAAIVEPCALYFGVSYIQRNTDRHVKYKSFSALRQKKKLTCYLSLEIHLNVDIKMNINLLE